MAGRTCLYGGRRKAGSPPDFTVDTGVTCFLFGGEHYLCKYIDTVLFDKGTTIRAIVKRMVKIAIGDLLEGNIDTDKFCATDPPMLLPDINWLDVFLCFNGTSCEVLNAKIAQLYQYKKWYEYCECLPVPPRVSPPPIAPILPPFPPPTPIPPGQCSACFVYWTDVYNRGRDVIEARVERLRQYAASIGFETRNVYRHDVAPIPRYVGAYNWELLNCPPQAPRGSCNCWIRIVSQVSYRVELVLYPNETRVWRDPPRELDWSDRNNVVTYYDYLPTACDDVAAPEGPIRVPPSIEGFCRFFPHLCKRKKKPGGQCCGCCGSQWMKNNELYLPSRYKV